MSVDSGDDERERARAEHAGGLLRLRRGVVVEEDPLTVEVGGERRPAWVDSTLLGEMREATR